MGQNRIITGEKQTQQIFEWCKHTVPSMAALHGSGSLQQAVCWCLQCPLSLLCAQGGDSAAISFLRLSALTFVGNIHPVCIQDKSTGVSLHHNPSCFHVFLIFWWLSRILIICLTLQSIFILCPLSRRWRGCCSFLFWFQQNCRLLAHLLLYFFFLFFSQRITALKNCNVSVEFLFVIGFSFSW